ncbi:hypothetical protein [Candidatus Protochlamydia phocaeensis]|uniref:hypothetical protein n=1 Tax=Candidatus Protochlamydia phocaeensis TaxID=1414722 RepID=UPI000838D3B0|nr:hypothetical protein [Candidatus Protochlamydia phocaeensis]
MLKKLLCLYFFFLFPYMCLQADLSGAYEVSGFDPFLGQRYTGVAILEKQEETYAIYWTFSDGTYNVGTGVRDGDQISFIFRGVEDPNYLGVQVYEFKRGRLKGPWTLLGSSVVGIEKLKKIETQ